MNIFFKFDIFEENFENLIFLKVIDIQNLIIKKNLIQISSKKFISRKTHCIHSFSELQFFQQLKISLEKIIDFSLFALNYDFECQRVKKKFRIVFEMILESHCFQSLIF